MKELAPIALKFFGASSYYTKNEEVFRMLLYRSYLVEYFLNQSHHPTRCT